MGWFSIALILIWPLTKPNKQGKTVLWAPTYMFSEADCAAWTCLFYIQHLCCLCTCLSYSTLCCLQTYLFYSSLGCPWALFYSRLCCLDVSVLHYSICAASVHAYPTAPYAAFTRICSTAAWAAPGHCSTAAMAAWTDMSFLQQPLLLLEVSVLLQSVCLLSSSLYCTIPGGTWPTAFFAAAKDVSGFIVRFVCLQEHVLHLFMCFCVAQYCLCL